MTILLASRKFKLLFGNFDPWHVLRPWHVTRPWHRARVTSFCNRKTYLRWEGWQPNFEMEILKYIQVSSQSATNDATCLILNMQVWYLQENVLVTDLTVCLFISILRSIAESAIHDSCSAFNTTQLQSERASFQDLVRKTIGRRFDNVGADVEDLQVTSSMGISMRELESDELKNKVSNLVPRGFQPLHLSPRRKGMWKEMKEEISQPTSRTQTFHGQAIVNYI